MRSKIFPWIILACFLVPITLLALFMPLNSELESYDLSYYIEENDDVSFHNLHVDAEISLDNKIYVTETFSVTFNTWGLTEVVRALPYYSTIYRENNAGKVEKQTVINKITGISKESYYNEELNVYTDEIQGFVVVGIKADTYIPENSTRSYTLSYTYDLGEDYNKGFDDVYFNLVGTNSLLTINNITFTVSFPDDVDIAKNIKIYYGKEGSTKTLEYIHSGNMIAGNIEKLSPYEGITLRAVFNDGYLKTSPEFSISSLIGVILGSLLIGVLVLYLLKIRNKNIIVPIEVVKPENMNTFMAEFYNDSNVSIKAVIAVIVEMANKGYLKINQHEEKIDFTKLKDISEDEPSSYKRIFNKIFDSEDKVKLEDVGEKLGKTSFGIIQSQNSYLRKNLYEKKSEKEQKIIKYFVTIGAIAIFAMLIVANLEYLGFVPMIYCINFVALAFNVIGLLILMWLNVKNYIASSLISIGSLLLIIMMYAQRGFVSIDGYYLILISFILLFVTFIFLKGEPKMNKEKAIEKGRVLGFKKFIKNCEVEQLKMFVNENPSYYFDILPYAYVFGLSDEWIKKFESIKVEIPETFTSDAMPITDMMIYSSLFHSVSKNIKTSALKYNISRSTSSGGFSGGGIGGGGFSGGGFSGGGSGGGGFGAR